MTYMPGDEEDSLGFEDEDGKHLKSMLALFNPRLHPGLHKKDEKVRYCID
jgi:hypothetical protein